MSQQLNIFLELRLSRRWNARVSHSVTLRYMPGDRILVRPGLYMIGDGDLVEVVIEVKGHDAALFQAGVAL